MSGYRNKFPLIALSALACVIPHFAQDAIASIPYDRPISTLYEESSLVVNGKIIGISASCDEHQCGPTVYKFKVNLITKNASSMVTLRQGDEVTFCTHGQLAIGKQYMVFMHQPSKDEKPSTGNEGKCEFAVNHDGMFMPVGDKTYFRVWSGKAYEIFTYKDEMRKAENTYFTFGIEVPNFLDLIHKAKGP